jgi:oligopeptide/dipeptide ABC transporter ATP-binding protein
VVESGSAGALFAKPAHPYTRGLLACVPIPGKTPRDQPLGSIPGVVPRIREGFAGCAFRDRCAQAVDACAGDIPRRIVAPDHETICTLAAA